MSRTPYAAGDRVVLKPGLLRQSESERICRIVGVLPADHGEVQYRVRLDGETFERRILHSDIDPQETAAPAARAGATASVPGSGSPWLKPLSSRNAK